MNTLPKEKKKRWDISLLNLALRHGRQKDNWMKEK